MKDFEINLRDSGRAEHTVSAYNRAVDEFFELYEVMTSENVRKYRNYLLNNYSPQTVNLRLNGINSYLRFKKVPIAPVHLVRISQSSFVENVISVKECEIFKSKLKEDRQDTLYFLIRFMLTTGMRVSEVILITTDDVITGHKDVYSKGGKSRRVYFPASLQKEALEWVSVNTAIKDGGFIFLNQRGERISDSGIRYLLRLYARKYGIEESHAHPHAFRHRFALNFLKKSKDLVLLSDLMGHDSVETTRIYLKHTSEEQKEIVNKVVDW